MAQPVHGLPGRPRKHQCGWEENISMDGYQANMY